MSVYSTDSLENINEISPRNKNILHKNIGSNLVPTKTLIFDLFLKPSLSPKSITPSLSQRQDKSNKIYIYIFIYICAILNELFSLIQ